MVDGMRKPPTSFDVARLAGVSRSTVSRAFTDGGKISTDVRKKVHEAAEQLGYHVNYLARGLQTRHSNLAGIVASRLDTPIRAVQVKAIAQEIIGHGMRPMLLTAESADDVGPLLNSMFSYNVAGMLVTSDTPPSAIIEECNRLGVPVVLINRDPVIEGADRVQMDPEEAGRLAFEMLHACRVRRFAVLSPRTRTYTVSGRADAFADHCRREGMPVVRILAENQSYFGGRGAAAEIAATIDSFEGLFCATDLLAMGALDAARLDCGVAVPERLQIVGFDDIEQAGWGAYQLSTIRQDVVRQARIAVELMLARIEEPARPPMVRFQTLTKVFRHTTTGPVRP